MSRGEDLIRKSHTTAAYGVDAFANRQDNITYVTVENVVIPDSHEAVCIGWSKYGFTVAVRPNDTLAKQEAEAKALLAKQANQRLIDQVSETTRGRRDNYGRPLVNFFRIAALWHDYLAGEGKLAPLQFISPEDVAFLMILLKVARAEHSFQTDNMLDILGYTDCLDDMNRQMKEMGYAEGLGALKTMSITEMGLLGDKLTHKT